MKTLTKILCVGAGIFTMYLFGCAQKDNNEHLTGIYLSKEDFNSDGKEEVGLVIEDPCHEGCSRIYYFKGDSDSKKNQQFY